MRPRRIQTVTALIWLLVEIAALAALLAGEFHALNVIESPETRAGAHAFFRDVAIVPEILTGGLFLGVFSMLRRLFK